MNLKAKNKSESRNSSQEARKLALISKIELEHHAKFTQG